MSRDWMITVIAAPYTAKIINSNVKEGDVSGIIKEMVKVTGVHFTQVMASVNRCMGKPN